MSSSAYGKVLAGDASRIRASYEHWTRQPVDLSILSEDDPQPPRWRTTLQGQGRASGAGTFFRRAQRTLHFEAAKTSGWWFKREDLKEALPIEVSIKNVWTAVRNIVLCSGSPHNYMRMVEHIVALKTGLYLDNVVVKMDSGDPPLFERGSLDLVEAVRGAGIIETRVPATTLTVKEPVTVGGKNGSFLTFLPADNGDRRLVVDCALDFRSAIGKQRLQFRLTPEVFIRGAEARTNTTLLTVIYCKTIGQLFADTRNLGYTMKNILVAGPRRYLNRPRLLHNGKSLEAVWHRAVLDLLAAVALIDRGRFAGKIVSYKSGHVLDVTMIRLLYEHDLLCPV